MKLLILIRNLYALSAVVALSCIQCLELRQPYSDLDTLLQEAQSTQGRLVTFLNTIKDALVVINPGIKGIKTINQLLKTRWSGDASRITDYSRATIGVDTIKAVYDCLAVLKSSALEIVAVTDNFARPTLENYRDINIVFRDTVNGMLGEMQINTLPILDYKNSEGHHLFDQIRNIKASTHIEGQSLTQEESDLISKLIRLSKEGYDKAFADSLIFDGKQIRIGVYALVTCDDYVLMVKTQSGKKTIMNLPGGGIETYEGFVDALKRECLEEVGIEVEIGELLYTSKNLFVHEDFPQSLMYNLYFTAKPIRKMSSGELTSQWIHKGSMPYKQMLPIDEEFLKEYSESKYS